MERLRLALSRLLACIGFATASGWFCAALLGREWVLLNHPNLSVSVGHWSNLRFFFWVLTGAFALHPQRDNLLERIEGVLEGRARWLAPLAFTAWAVAYKVTQHLAFGTGSYDLSVYHYAVRLLLQQT